MSLRPFGRAGAPSVGSLRRDLLLPSEGAVSNNVISMLRILDPKRIPYALDGPASAGTGLSLGPGGVAHRHLTWTAFDLRSSRQCSHCLTGLPFFATSYVQQGQSIISEACQNLNSVGNDAQRGDLEV